MVEAQKGVAARRRQQRAELLARRRALAEEERRAIATRILAYLEDLRPALEGPLALYWPIRGEVDLRGFAEGLAMAGTELALPVIVTRNAPMEFWRWAPGMAMREGIWKIPIPAERAPLLPRTLLLPLVGFDAAGYRLGYGGGYYDRTLAVLRPRPRLIGIGYGFSRLATIHPEPHDQRLDLVVTEQGIERFPAEEEPVRCASPPCFGEDVDPAWMGLAPTKRSPPEG